MNIIGIHGEGGGEINQNPVYIYRKDNLDGHSSNACTDDRFFYEEILFF